VNLLTFIYTLKTLELQKLFLKIFLETFLS